MYCLVIICSLIPGIVCLLWIAHPVTRAIVESFGICCFGIGTVPALLAGAVAAYGIEVDSRDILRVILIGTFAAAWLATYVYLIVRHYKAENEYNK